MNISAIQGFDALHAGLMDGLEAIRDRNQARANDNALLKLIEEYNQLAKRHNILLAERNKNFQLYISASEMYVSCKEDFLSLFCDVENLRKKLKETRIAEINARAVARALVLHASVDVQAFAAERAQLPVNDVLRRRW